MSHFSLQKLSFVLSQSTFLPMSSFLAHSCSYLPTYLPTYLYCPFVPSFMHTNSFFYWFFFYLCLSFSHLSYLHSQFTINSLSLSLRVLFLNISLDILLHLITEKSREESSFKRANNYRYRKKDSQNPKQLKQGFRNCNISSPIGNKSMSETV